MYNNSIDVITRENLAVNVPIDLWHHSVYVSKKIEQHPGIRDGVVEQEADPIFLTSVSTETLKNVISWLEMHRNDQPLKERVISLLPKDLDVSLILKQHAVREAEESNGRAISDSDTPMLHCDEQLSAVSFPKSDAHYNGEILMSLTKDEAGDYVYENFMDEVIREHELKCSAQQEQRQSFLEYVMTSEDPDIEGKIRQVNDVVANFRKGLTDFERNLSLTPGLTRLAEQFRDNRTALDACEVELPPFPDDPVAKFASLKECASTHTSAKDNIRELMKHISELQTNDRRPLNPKKQLTSDIDPRDYDFFKDLVKYNLFQLLKASKDLEIHLLNRNINLFICSQMGTTTNEMADYFIAK